MLKIQITKKVFMSTTQTLEMNLKEDNISKAHMTNQLMAKPRKKFEIIQKMTIFIKPILDILLIRIYKK